MTEYHVKIEAKSFGQVNDAIRLATVLGAKHFTLYVDDKALKSSLVPKNRVKLVSIDKAPQGCMAHEDMVGLYNSIVAFQNAQALGALESDDEPAKTVTPSEDTTETVEAVEEAPVKPKRRSRRRKKVVEEVVSEETNDQGSDDT